MGGADQLYGSITSVVYGDTIDSEMQGLITPVRLIGVDTPETKRPGVGVECGGPVATHYMLHLAFTRPKDTDGDGLFDKHGGTGRAVWVRTDPSQPGSTDLDGRSVWSG